MQMVHINHRITAIKYKNFKIINLIYIIFILNSVFTIMLYVMRWTKQYLIYMYFDFFNQLNLLYI
jgi:hypothetical protein